MLATAQKVSAESHFKDKEVSSREENAVGKLSDDDQKAGYMKQIVLNQEAKHAELVENAGSEASQTSESFTVFVFTVCMLHTNVFHGIG